MYQRNKLFASAIVWALLFACSSNSTKEEYRVGRKDINESYKIENVEFDKAGIKASYDIRITSKLSESDLESIAWQIKNQNQGYDRYFISYYLPNTKIGDGGWATTHFDPDLDIRIIGLSLEEEKAMNSNKSDIPGKIVGKWFDETPYTGSVLTIFEKDEGYTLHKLYTDGSSGEKTLKLEGQKFIYENEFGEYYQVLPDGNLGLYDNDGLISTMEKI